MIINYKIHINFIFILSLIFEFMIINLWFDHRLLIYFLIYELFSLAQYKLLHLTFILSNNYVIG